MAAMDSFILETLKNVSCPMLNKMLMSLMNSLNTPHTDLLCLYQLSVLFSHKNTYKAVLQQIIR